MDLQLGPSGLKKASFRRANKKLHLYDKTGLTAKVLENAGIPYRKADAVEDIENPDAALIIGVDSLAGICEEKGKRINTMVKEGLTLLVLEQHPEILGESEIPIDWIDETPLTIVYEKENQEDFVYITDLSSPIFEGLGQESFRMWNGDTHVLKSFLRQGTEVNFIPAKTSLGGRFGWNIRKLPHVKTYGECFYFLKYDALLEIPFGKGRIVFNQMECSSKHGDDPCATAYMNNLLRYIVM